jgi:hypothetical protein
MVPHGNGGVRQVHFSGNYLTCRQLFGLMSPASRTKDTPPPTWDDIREEASQLTREMLQQSIVWSHRAFTLASHMAEMTAKATEETVQKAGETLDKVRRR